jgi:hypothetical protein
MERFAAIRRARYALAAAGLAAMLVAAACDGGDSGERTPTSAVPAATATPDIDPRGRVTLSGTLTLDGAPLDADFLGARVIRDGLPAACQAEIPPVVLGSYEIPVLADAEARGCGAPGAQIALWAYVADVYYFTTETLPWPGDGASATFDAAFSSAAPLGATTAVTEFKGVLRDAKGDLLPPGTVVEAFAGGTRCGVTSLRKGDATENLYVLVVAGPDAVPGCALGATLELRLDGQPALPAAVNDLGSGSGGHELDLSVR